MATTIQVERTAATNSPEGRYLSRQPWMVSLAALYLVALFTLAWYRHATYRSFGYDLGYFDQSVWLMAHGHAPFVTLIGRDIFADHFSPVLILFVPFYAIVSTPAWLLGGQALALGVGLLALGPLLDQLEVPRRWHIALALAYVSSPALWNAGLYDFHTSTLAVPFLLVGLTAALRDDARMLALMSLVVILARDDLALAVVALLLVGFRQSVHRRLRISLALAAVAWALIAGRFGSVNSPEQWAMHYAYLGPNSVQVLLHPLRSVGRATTQIWSGQNLMSALGWLVPLAFLPLLSPSRTALGFLWILPLFASARFSTGYLPTFHYGAPLFPFLLVATGTAATRFRDQLTRLVGPVVIAASVALSLVVFNPFASWIWDVRSPAPAEAAEGLRHLKSTDRVTATSTLTAHLSHRVLLLPFPYPFMQGDEPTPLDRSVTRVGLQLVASIDAVAIYMGEDASSLKVRQAFIRLPALQEFRLVFDRGGVLIYRRAGSTPSS